MPSRHRTLIVEGGTDDFHEELIERAIGLRLSVKAIRQPAELPAMLRIYGFDWIILDLAMGEPASRKVIRHLAAKSRKAEIVLIGRDENVLASVRRNAVAKGLTIAGALSRPLSSAALGTALGRGAWNAKGEAVRRDPVFGRRKAIPNDQIVVHYQPVIGIKDRRIRTVEALVRWRHPKLGLLKPERFIGQAERSGAIAPLTWAVLRQAVDQHVAWKKQGLLLRVSVNISALFLESLKAADNILRLLQRKGFEPHNLTLEITETKAARNPAVARAVLTRLNKAGIAISMDDYGVGFSNLERMRLLPFNDLKIDRWIVARVDGSLEARRTVKMLADLAAKQAFSLTGEGIETEAQWRQLRRLGCHFGQGFHIARPMPADRVPRWVGRMRQSGRYRARAAA
jgi:EAL domain-containing protein (putative c-di-GMP-specific phosphodiesterase class I)